MAIQEMECPAVPPAPATGVDAALFALNAGHPVMVIDEARGHGYFACAADRGEERFVALATEHGRGVLKVALTPERLDALGLPALAGADCRVPVDLAGCERPGDAAAERMATLRALARHGLDPERLVTPGHVFPTAAGDCAEIDDARVLLEAARMAGCAPVAAFCEAVEAHPSPRLAERAPGLAALAARVGVEAVTVRALLVARERRDPAVVREVQTAMPTAGGPLTAFGFVGARTGEEYVAFVAGTAAPAVRVHVHRRCPVSDVFGGACGCGGQLRDALAEVQAAGDGILVYYGAPSLGLCEGVAPVTWAATAEVAALLSNLGVRRAVLSSNAALDLRDLADLGVTATAVVGAAQ